MIYEMIYQLKVIEYISQFMVMLDRMHFICGRLTGTRGKFLIKLFLIFNNSTDVCIYSTTLICSLRIPIMRLPAALNLLAFRGDTCTN